MFAAWTEAAAPEIYCMNDLKKYILDDRLYLIKIMAINICMQTDAVSA